MEAAAMIEKTSGNLLQADVEALVNTVNTDGFMGKGIALQFKQAFPANFEAYRKAVERGEVRPGSMFVFETGSILGPRFIINFPTKRHWRQNSRMEDIESGLAALVREIRDREIRSIAIPPLGCGNGGLDWSDVRPRIERALAEVPNVHALIYEPKGAPDPREMPIGTPRPDWTPARALLVALMHRYGELAYRRTLLEIQKLAYFLQEAGEPLRLRFEAGHYGPYAPNLNKVLERLEGHFTRGYGDSQKPDVEIELLPGAFEEAARYLADLPESSDRLRRVSDLIEGFETPYGMELLASVHWVAAHAPRAADVAGAIAAVHVWSARKKNVFQANHIAIAWERLAETGWLPSER
jgi:O-acetyl-ADP-ribose deacetylase (regulator of RNase III)